MNREKLRFIIKPSLFQVICCLVASFLLFGIVFGASFGHVLLNGVEKSANVDQQTFTLSYQHEIAQVGGNVVARWVSVAVLIVASILILTFVLISGRRTFSALRTEVITAEDDAKALRARHQSARQPVLKLIAHLVVILGLVVFIFISMQILLPLWLALFGVIFTIKLQAIVVLAVTLALTGLTINFYCIWTLAQIIVAMR